MIRTPQRLLVFLIIFCVIIAQILEYLETRLNQHISYLIPQNVNNELLLGRYYWLTGRPDTAILEYKDALKRIPKESLDDYHVELRNLIFFTQNTYWRFISGLYYSFWATPSMVYFLVLIFILIFVVLSLIRYFGTPPKFVILPFEDYSGLGIGKNIPQLSVDRINEILWRSKNVNDFNTLIAENLEIPTLGVISEGDSKGMIELLSTALKFSVGYSDFPLNRIVESLKIWIEQPEYQVRGIIECKDQLITIKMQLVNNKKNRIETVWDAVLNLADDFAVSGIIDLVIYPLLFYMNKFYLDHKIQATRWEVIKDLHLGLEEFQRYSEKPDTLGHLQRAKQYMEHALLIDPGYRFAKYNLGLILIAFGDYDKAREYFLEVSNSIQVN